MTQKFYLISSHIKPCFLSPSGRWVDVQLDFVDCRDFHCIDLEGRLVNKHVESSRIFSDGEWMVESKESAIRALTNAGVYPFESKNAAKQFTAKHNIKNYKYLPV